MDRRNIKTLAELKKFGYKSQSIKEELRNNLIEKLKKNEDIFPNILGFEDTVIPDLERAILSKHNILLLGLRGQAKTKIARLLVHLLDEYIPAIKGSEINDDPLNPISRVGRDIVLEHGDQTPIQWLHRSQRYVEKLATPDVSISDLIGDVDPIKAATLKLPYSDERVIHFGLVPRAHRSIFVINELPDLQARIQVSLFNILEEGDMQIRGFKLRLPLDLQFVFTANPEDYTNRGSIVTPLKDRIESQILTHYPVSIDIAKEITKQEAKVSNGVHEAIYLQEAFRDIIEGISFEARDSEYVDEKSGVSARMSISAMENLYSSAERRMLKNGDKHTAIRFTDLWGIIPSITGKLELVYEGEQEGSASVALQLMGKTIKQEFLSQFRNPESLMSGKERDPYGTIKAWFSAGNEINLLNDDSQNDYENKLDIVAGLAKLANTKRPKNEDEKYYFMELILQGLAECELINKNIVNSEINFHDPLADIFDGISDN